MLTLHRTENTDDPKRLNNFLKSFEKISRDYKYKIIWPIHPRSKNSIKINKLKIPKNLICIDPLDFFNFIFLEKNSACVITDSGTVQEECAIFNIPNLTIRDTTERPETLETGSNFITGNKINSILKGISITLDNQRKNRCPEEYKYDNVSNTVLKIILQNYLDRTDV